MSLAVKYACRSGRFQFPRSISRTAWLSLDLYLFYLGGKGQTQLQIVTGFHLTRLPHAHKIKLTFLPEMDCWSNTLSYSTLYFDPSGLASLVSVAAFFRPCQSHK